MEPEVKNAQQTEQVFSHTETVPLKPAVTSPKIDPSEGRSNEHIPVESEVVSPKAEETSENSFQDQSEPAKEETTNINSNHNNEPPDSAAGVEFKSPALVKEQLKYCATLLKGLKRHPQSSPFQQPVDPIALNIPDYLDIIKHPMDLSTVNRKLEGGEYKDAEAFIADVRLMLSNCFTYNHPDSQVAKMGHSLEKYFNTSITKVPTTLPVPGTGDDSKRKSELVATPLSVQRSRRESHAPARLSGTSAVGSSTPRGRARTTANPEMAFCNSVLRELLKKGNQSVTWPFLEPVDPGKLGIPDYFDVIKQPMDLSTVRRKLDGGQYVNAEQFESDIRLVVSNCYAYNAPDSDVVNICRGFEKLFDSKWSQKPNQFNYSSGYDDADSDSEKILEINRQIQALQQELNSLLMKRKNRGSMSGATPRPKKPSSKASVSKPTIITEEEFLSRPMSFDEKRQLSIEVNNLPPEKLGKVVEIIQAGMALEAQGDSDVIELDIESLNVRTLRQLQKYVMECKGITSLAVILGENTSTKRKKIASSGTSAKKASSTGGGTNATPANAAAAAAVAMSSDEEESSDEDLD